MFKRLMVLFCFLSLLSGCVTGAIQFAPAPNDCIDPAQYPDSVILDTLDNPCQVHKVLGAVAKGGLVMKKYTSVDFHLWVEDQIKKIALANELSARTAKDVIIARISELNTEAGLAAFIVSDTFLLFSDETIFKGDDLSVIILALRDIDKQVQAMAAIAGL